MKILRTVPYIMAVTAAMAMVLAAQCLGMPEIMLPTFGALITGTWLVDTNLWHYSLPRLIISVPLAACAGLLLSIFIAERDYSYVYPCLYAAYLLTAAILVTGRTQIYPCFGAAALPVLFQTQSWAYPISVLCMVTILAAGRVFLQKLSLRQPLKASEFPGHRVHRRERGLYYLQLSVGIVPALILVPIIGDHFLLLPPLFVTYATFCNAHSTFVQHPKQTWLQIVSAIAIGMGVFAVGQHLCGSPDVSASACHIIMAVSAGVSCLCTILVGTFFHRLFPPAMSLALTPFLIQYYPQAIPYVAVMSVYFIFIAWSIRSHPAYKPKDLEYL